MPVYKKYTPPTVTVDKKALKDWVWDFRAKTNGNGSEDWLDTGDTVSSLTIVAPTGVTLESQETINTSTSVRAWFSFADATVDTEYQVEASLLTDGGRKDEFPIIFYVIDV